MTAPTFSYIASDFASAAETCSEYRSRVAAPHRPNGLRRVRRLIIRV
jgi:hypothetical protein